MFLPPHVLTFFSFLLLSQSSSAADTKPTDKPCTIHSPLTGSFYDLRPLQALPLNLAPKASLARNESWHARGYDYPSNFTLNICGPVVENLTDIEGISKSRAANISAFYTDPATDTLYSIGQQNDELLFRGKKLLLNYTHGSPCPDLDEHGSPVFLPRREIINDPDDEDDDDDDDHDEPKKKKPSPKKPVGSTRYKSTLLSFSCDTSTTATTHPTITFLGTLDQCTYNFEVRSRYACAGTTPSTDPGSLGPGGVFGVILGIALLVYLIGGCVYNRTVMHQRGWRQLPNYAVWSGIGGFIGDAIVILFSTCTRGRGLPSLFGGTSTRAGGYHRVGAEDRGSARGRTHDDENRLIDELDEDWDA